MGLPAGHSEKWSSFEDYLKWYNLSDVLPASHAMISEFTILAEIFGIQPIVCYGLPSYSQRAMFKMLNPESPSCFSIAPQFEHLVKLFRDNTYGGIVNVYARHITTLDEEASTAAKENSYGLY